VTDTIWPPDLRDSVESKYIVLVQSMRGAIRSGALEPGYKMPPVRELAWQLGITPGTVARAYKIAADEGLVETAVGRGTFVRGDLVFEAAPESLISMVSPEAHNFRGVRVPDVGQDQAIRRQLGRLSQQNTNLYIDYPTQFTDIAARRAVVRWIGADRIGRVSEDDIVLGLGAQNSVIMALQAVLHGPNPVILTEELAYPGVRHAARLLRAQLVGVEMDAEGVRPDRLEEALRKHGGQVFLTAAEVHSPTTIRTTLARKQEIAQVAQKYQLQIIEDDCHCITRPEEPAYRAICPERAWFISSLTKTVSAAVRFGYSVAPQGQAANARQVAQSSFYGLPQPIMDLCAGLMQSGEAEDIRRKVQATTLHRVKDAVNVLGKWDIAWRPDVPFIWLKLPQGWRGSSFARACGDMGIQIKASDEFALPDGAAPNALRISLNPPFPRADDLAAFEKMSQLLAQPPVNVDF